MSRVVGKPGLCICENKDADQLRSNREADQRLCFRYTDSAIPLLFQASSYILWLYSPVCVRPGRKPRRPVFSERGSIIKVGCKDNQMHGRVSMMLFTQIASEIF